MKVKKYLSYTLASEDADSEVFYNYQEAFTAFQQCKCSATLYGCDEQNDMATILSK